MIKKERREFLKVSAAAIGGLAILPVSCRDQVRKFDKSPVTGFPGMLDEGQVTALSESPFEDIRNLFRFYDGIAPLNAANLCPCFTHSLQKLTQYQRQLSASPGFVNRNDFVKSIVGPARKRLAEILGVDHKYLALTRNTSESNSMVVQGFDLQPEDEVVLWSSNHDTNMASWHYESARRGFRVRSIEMDIYQTDVEYYIDQFEKAVTGNTRVISFSHISNITGAKLPAAEIAAAIKKSNDSIHVHIDGAQSFGSLALDLGNSKIDSYSASGHKWLCGPWGTGLLYVRRSALKGMAPNILGYDFGFHFPDDGFPNDHRRFESLGQRDTAVYGALGEAAKLHLAIGPSRIEQRIRELTEYGRGLLRESGIGLIGPGNSAFSHGILTMDLGSNIKAKGAFLGLHNRGVACAYVGSPHMPGDKRKPKGKGPVYFRLSPNFYNTKRDIADAVTYVRKIMDSPFKIVNEVITFI